MTSSSRSSSAGPRRSRAATRSIRARSSGRSFTREPWTSWTSAWQQPSRSARRFDTPEDAVAVANRVRYGLTSTILAGDGLTSTIPAGDTYKAFELAPKVWHRVVNVNSPTLNEEIHAPIGGVRDSGWGRTGPDGLADFTDVIWINATSRERELPF
jgi:hypothetical protein